MPKAIPNPGIKLEALASHSDPSVPLVSVFTPFRKPTPDPYHPDDTDAVPAEPRPRPSLQVYYTPPLTAPDELAQAARALETAVLANRFDHSGAPYERLDVYSLPGDEAEEAPRDGLFATAAAADTAVRRCVAHQRAEIAAREGEGDREWVIQRYDVPRGEWGRAIVVVRTTVAEWGLEEPGRGLVVSTVMFDHAEDGAPAGEVWVQSGSSEGDVGVLVGDVRAELNWEHSYVQFLD